MTAARFAALTVVVPRSVPSPGLAPMVTVTTASKLVSTVPALSCALTRTAGESGSPAVPSGGGAKTSRGGAGSGLRPAWNRASILQPSTQTSPTTPAPTRSRRRGARPRRRRWTPSPSPRWPRGGKSRRARFSGSRRISGVGIRYAARKSRAASTSAKDGSPVHAVALVTWSLAIATARKKEREARGRAARGAAARRRPCLRSADRVRVPARTRRPRGRA